MRVAQLLMPRSSGKEHKGPRTHPASPAAAGRLAAALLPFILLLIGECCLCWDGAGERCAVAGQCRASSEHAMGALLEVCVS